MYEWPCGYSKMGPILPRSPLRRRSHIWLAKQKVQIQLNNWQPIHVFSFHKRLIYMLLGSSFGRLHSCHKISMSSRLRLWNAPNLCTSLRCLGPVYFKTKQNDGKSRQTNNSFLGREPVWLAAQPTQNGGGNLWCMQPAFLAAKNRLRLARSDIVVSLAICFIAKRRRSNVPSDLSRKLP